MSSKDAGLVGLALGQILLNWFAADGAYIVAWESDLHMLCLVKLSACEVAAGILLTVSG